MTTENVSAVRSCCSDMAAQTAWRCEDHDDPWECPDALIVTFSDGRRGLPVRDGGSSAITIAFCPWCGTSLT